MYLFTIFIPNFLLSFSILPTFMLNNTQTMDLKQTHAWMNV